ncbi:MAG: DUF3365 domain-containing protein [Nitrospirae bacterium YQR-1]
MTKNIKRTKSNFSLLYRSATAISLVWTIIAACSLIWTISNERNKTIGVVTKEALANFNKDQAFRLWAARHGGVYVPPDNRTPPNPHLSHIPDRDVVTTSGKALTLMNPAYMLRQMMDEYSDLYGIKGRITSFKYLNPNNKPDQWESNALKAFQNGKTEVTDISMINGRPYLRFMKPMMTTESCLKCHGHQGYKVGDIRGGVGVSVPMTPYLKIEGKTIRNLVLTHILFWLIGLTGIFYGLYLGRRAITEQSRAQELLRDSEERLSSITYVLGEGVYMLDKEGCVTFMNPEAERLLGWKETELIGKRMHSVIHHKKDDGTVVSQEACPVEKVVTSGNTSRIDDDVFIKKDGTMFPVAYVSTPIIKDGEVTASVTAFQDITERKIAQELERNKHKEQLLFEKKRHLAISELLMNIAHHWRQPLNVVGVIAQEINDAYNFKELNAEFLDQSVSTIMKELRSLSDTISIFKDIYSNRKDIESFSVHEIIRNTLAAINTYLQNNNTKIETQLNDDIVILGYPQDLSQSMINIITNSVEIFRERNIENGFIRITLHKAAKNDKAVIAISDNGGGITNDIMDKIFDPYFTTKFKSKGTGLGLYLTKAIIEKEMNGTLSVGNTEDGAEFIIEI